MEHLTGTYLTNELGIPPEKYALAIDPSRDTWELKMKDGSEIPQNEIPKLHTPPDNGKGTPPEEKVIEQSLESRKVTMTEALRKRAEAVQKAEDDFKKAEEDANKVCDTTISQVVKK